MAGTLIFGHDYYWDNGRMVLTEGFLRRRGTCCGNGCRHCPYGRLASAEDASRAEPDCSAVADREPTSPEAAS